MKEADLVDLRDHSVQHLPLEGPEDDGLVLDRVDDKASAGLDDARSNVVNRRHSNNKSIPKAKQNICLESASELQFTSDKI